MAAGWREAAAERRQPAAEKREKATADWQQAVARRGVEAEKRKLETALVLSARLAAEHSIQQMVAQLGSLRSLQQAREWSRSPSVQAGSLEGARRLEVSL